MYKKCQSIYVQIPPPHVPRDLSPDTSDHDQNGGTRSEKEGQRNELVIELYSGRVNTSRKVEISIRKNFYHPKPFTVRRILPYWVLQLLVH